MLTDRAFRSLLPDDVQFVDTSTSLAAVLHPDEERFIAGARDTRREEFAAGRTCARLALHRLGIEDFPLLPDENRAPLWPRGVTGSITHSGGYCAVAVARQSAIRALGIDSEVMGRFTEKLWPRVCTPGELEWLLAQTADRRGSLAAAIFGAKEAVYKCQYQITRRWLGFQDVEISLAQDSFDVHFTQRSPVDPRVLTPLSGRYVVRDQFVLCAAVIATPSAGTA